MTSRLALSVLLALLATAEARADQTLVAAATNFAAIANVLRENFEKASHHRVVIASGSTGKLYAQIVHGAPYDVLLAADQERPLLLQHSGDAVSGSRFVYAIGHLTLWSPDKTRIATDGQATLRAGQFDSLAIANPLLAPYGVAAQETLRSLNLMDFLEAKIVMAENIGQTHALVATGNAQLGFVALSNVLSSGHAASGSRWDVPANLYTPILQDAVLLRHGIHNAAASAFLAYLQTDSARMAIVSSGYGVE